MKNQLLNYVFGLSLLAMISLSGTGCHRIDGAKANAALGHYLECIKQCDSLQLVYEKEYRKCLHDCLSVSDEVIRHCKYDLEEKRIVCYNETFTERDKCINECERIFDGHMEEIRSCRKACVDKFIKESNLKPALSNPN